MANVTKEEIMHIAKLADLNLNEEEMERYTKDMEDILNFANIINEANTKEIEQDIGKKQNVFRKDEVKQDFTREELMQNAEEVSQGMFRIPKVIS